MQTATGRYLVRPMAVGDIAQVLEIERESFSTAWPPTAYRQELEANRLARYLVAVEVREEGEKPEAREEPRRPEATGFGRFLSDLKRVFAGVEGEPLPPPGERSQLIVGFVGVWLMVNEAHIVTLAVRESHRGRGIGELLLIAAIELAQEHREPVISLECRVSNRVALTLYEKYGFKQVGLRPRYYSDNQEDAYLLSTEEVRSAAFQERFQRLKEEHAQRWGQCQLQL